MDQLQQKQIFTVVDPSRVITFSTTQASAVVIKDEDLVDLSATIAGALGYWAESKTNRFSRIAYKCI